MTLLRKLKHSSYLKDSWKRLPKKVPPRLLFSFPRANPPDSFLTWKKMEMLLIPKTKLKGTQVCPFTLLPRMRLSCSPNSPTNLPVHMQSGSLMLMRLPWNQLRKTMTGTGSLLPMNTITLNSNMPMRVFLKFYRKLIIRPFLVTPTPTLLSQTNPFPYMHFPKVKLNP